MATKKKKSATKALTAAAQQTLLATLKARFDKHAARHKGIAWAAVEARLLDNVDALPALAWMEETGGEPDVVLHDTKSGEVVFFDCAAETPKGRRSICYDQAALDARKENKPAHSALGLCDEIGVDILDEEQYRFLQTLGTFDAKTSSWVKTPPAIRALGGAIFCDWRYGTVFMYHNGADSYYAARSFRAALRV